MANLYSKNFDNADEVKNPPKAKVQDTESFLLNRSDSPNSYPLRKNHNSPMELKRKREIYNISRPEPSSFPIGNNFENKVNSLSEGKDK